MRRAKTKAPAVPAGALGLVTINGLESILLPSAVAHKLLPLLEKGIGCHDHYEMGTGRRVLREGAPLQVAYRMVDRDDLQLDQAVRPVSGEALPYEGQP